MRFSFLFVPLSHAVVPLYSLCVLCLYDKRWRLGLYLFWVICVVDLVSGEKSLFHTMQKCITNEFLIELAKQTWCWNEEKDKNKHKKPKQSSKINRSDEGERGEIRRGEEIGTKLRLGAPQSAEPRKTQVSWCSRNVVYLWKCSSCMFFFVGRERT